MPQQPGDRSHRGDVHEPAGGMSCRVVRAAARQDPAHRRRQDDGHQEVRNSGWQPVRDERWRAGDLHQRRAQPVAVVVRPPDRRPLHRRRRPGCDRRGHRAQEGRASGQEPRLEQVRSEHLLQEQQRPQLRGLRRRRLQQQRRHGSAIPDAAQPKLAVGDRRPGLSRQLLPRSSGLLLHGLHGAPAARKLEARRR